MKARLTFSIMILLTVVESVLVAIDCEYTQDEETYALYTNSQDKCRQILNIFCNIEWLGCKHFKSFELHNFN